jgi:hypothetical protein
MSNELFVSARDFVEFFSVFPLKTSNCWSKSVIA